MSETTYFYLIFSQIDLVNSQIPAKIIQQVKGPKITVLKTRPKKRYTRTRGHRQDYTRVQIDTLN